MAIELGDTWAGQAGEGEIKNVFQNSIEIGICLDEGGEAKYYALDLHSGNKLGGEVKEKRVPGTDFVIQYNDYRKYKPGGEKKLELGRQHDVPAGRDQCRFSCGNQLDSLSLLNRKPGCQIVLKNARWNAYYNALPIEEGGHYMWVPVERGDGEEKEREIMPHIPQTLTREFVEDILTIFRGREDCIICYNSPHAGESVDHLHPHDIVYKRHLGRNKTDSLKNSRLAIENAKTRSYNGYEFLSDYPVNGFVFSREVDVDRIWPVIERLQGYDIPFNLIMIGSRICIIPRRAKHEVVEEFPNVLASVELAGKIIAINEDVYNNTNKERIESACGKLSYDLEEILAITNLKHN